MSMFPSMAKVRVRRRFAAIAGLFALLLQLAVPVLHERDSLVVSGVHHSGGSELELHIADWRTEPAAHHDAARCSQCRIVSQARTLSAPMLVVASPLVQTDRLEAASPQGFPAPVGLESVSPRGPPSFA
jgi:hypothetical protein